MAVEWTEGLACSHERQTSNPDALLCDPGCGFCRMQRQDRRQQRTRKGRQSNWTGGSNNASAGPTNATSYGDSRRAAISATTNGSSHDLVQERRLRECHDPAANTSGTGNLVPATKHGAPGCHGCGDDRYLHSSLERRCPRATSSQAIRAIENHAPKMTERLFEQLNSCANRTSHLRGCLRCE